QSVFSAWGAMGCQTGVQTSRHSQRRSRAYPAPFAEFIRRFALHILPKGFVKIRHYGFLSSTWKREKLKNLQLKLTIKIFKKPTKSVNVRKCNCCKTGTLHTIEVFDRRGPPVRYLGDRPRINPCKN